MPTITLTNATSAINNLNSTQSTALNTLLTGGLTAGAIAQAINAIQIQNTRSASVSAIPEVPAISSANAAVFQSWLLDGNGVTDGQGDAQLAMNAIAAGDMVTAMTYICQTWKDVVSILYPNILTSGLAAIAAEAVPITATPPATNAPATKTS